MEIKKYEPTILIGEKPEKTIEEMADVLWHRDTEPGLRKYKEGHKSTLSLDKWRRWRQLHMIKERRPLLVVEEEEFQQLKEKIQERYEELYNKEIKETENHE